MNSIFEQIKDKNSPENPIVILGLGSAGMRLSRLFAELGLYVAAICLDGDIGGTCTGRGCVPKKIASLTAEDILKRKKDFPFMPIGNVDTQLLIRQKIAAVKKSIQKRLGEYDKLRIIYGRAKIAEDKSVVVTTDEGEERLSPSAICIATGSTPAKLNVEGNEHIKSSDYFFDHLDTSKRMELVIIGGGYIACELARISNIFGASVKMLLRRDVILTNFVKEHSELVWKEMVKPPNFEIIPNTGVKKVRKTIDGYKITVVGPEGEREIICDEVISAVGRVPNTSGLGLENLQINLDEKTGQICVDEYFYAGDNVFAIGDIIGGALTPIAIWHANKLASHFGGEKVEDIAVHITAAFVPGASITNIEDPVFEGIKNEDFVVSHKMSFTGLDDQLYSFKMFFNKESGRIYKISIFGSLKASEMGQIVAMLIAQGLNVANYVDNVLSLHPTFAEDFMAFIIGAKKYLVKRK